MPPGTLTSGENKGPRGPELAAWPCHSPLWLEPGAARIRPARWLELRAATTTRSLY